MSESRQYRKKPVVITAAQWFKNGDHPDDYNEDNYSDDYDTPTTEGVTGEQRRERGWEGAVVRYYRHPEVSGDTECKHCGRVMHDHGWIDTLEGGHIVCPGDWVITGVQGERYPCKPDIFEATYELVDHEDGAQSGPPPERLVVVGGPKTGKTTLVGKMEDINDTVRVVHTDDFMDLGWSEASQAVADWMTINPDGPWVVEGVAAVRALRKMLEANPDVKPCDRIVVLLDPHEQLTPGQQSMTKGLHTVLDEIRGQLLDLGVTIDWVGGHQL